MEHTPLTLQEESKRVQRQFCLVQLFYGFAWASMTYFILLLQSTGMSPQEVGLIMSLNSFAALIAPPLWGMLADKRGSRKRLFIWLLLASGITFALIPASALINVFGVNLVAIFLPAVTFIRQPTVSIIDTIIVNTTEHFGGIDYSTIRRWSSLGFAIMSPVYSWLIPKTGIELPYYLFLVFCLCTIFFMRTLPDYSKPVEKQTETHREKLHLSRIFKDYYLIVFLIFNILLSFGGQIYYFISYLLESVQEDPQLVGLFSGLKTIAEITMLSLAPRLKKYLSLPQMLCLSGLLYAVEPLLYPFCNNAVQICLVQMLNGAGFGTLLASAVNYAYSLAPKGLETTVTSLYGIGMGVAGIIANAFAGWAIETLGIHWMYRITGLTIGTAVVLFILSFTFGRLVLKKMPPLPFSLKKAD